MQKFERLDAVAVPMPEGDINTDQVVPARFMHLPRVDYGRYCFHDLRFHPDGSTREGYVLNHPAYAKAGILVAGPNFGCGSSREHAVFTLADYGFRAVLATSFADIFFANCLQNGVLPAPLPADFIGHLLALLAKAPGTHVAVDLERQTVSAPDGAQAGFEIDPFRKDCLLRGLDELDVTMAHLQAIEEFEARREKTPANLPSFNGNL
ncbi:MAG: 3-isopropylmalate dehydratase small subunit [Comamonadaceae bacterium]|nr:MAG: 3-isopropylmalate dehydratase small subunit [Comamonadaceae bacterium]